MKFYKHVTTVLTWTEETVAILCMAGIAVLTVGAVISRYFLHYSIAWSEELERYLFIWGAMFGAAVGFKHGAHSGLPLLMEKLPLKARQLSSIAISLVVAGFLVVIVWLGIGLIGLGIESWQVSPATKIPYWVVNFGLVAGLALCAYRVLEALAASFFKK